MGQFEDYLEKSKKGHSEVFRINEYQKTLTQQLRDPMIEDDYLPHVDNRYDDYDSEHLLEKLDRRMEDSTYKERTLYYFQDEGLYAAKAQRYWNLDKDGSELEDFAKTYTHHSARKRKRAAGAAGKAFAKATLLVRENAKKEKEAKNDYEVYELREAVMRLRMEGMEKAAEVKAKDETHETFLKNKAKLSCLTILQDQLQTLREKAASAMKKDRALTRKFDEKDESLSREIQTVKDKLSALSAQVRPKTKDTLWLEKNDLQEKANALLALDKREAISNEEMVKRKENERRAAKTKREGWENTTKQKYLLNSDKEEAARSLAILQTLREQSKEKEYPYYTVRLDRHDQPIEIAEAEKMEWNRAYRIAIEENDPIAKKKFMQDVINRIEGYRIPGEFELWGLQNNHVVSTAFRSKPAEYEEMFLRAPAFFKEELEKEDSYLSQYAKDHPAFQKKIDLMTSIGEVLKYSLNSLGIDTDNAKMLEETDLYDSKILLDMQIEVKKQLSDYQKTVADEKRRREEKVADEKRQRKRKEQKAPKKPLPDLELETQAERDAEYEALHRENPLFTQKHYEVYKGIQSCTSVYSNQGYTDRLKRLSKDYLHLQGVHRDLGLVLRAVHYDKKGRPISEEDRRRVEQNEKWIKAWEDHDEKTQTMLIQQSLSHVFDGFDLPDPEHAEQWFKKNLENRTFEFVEMIHRTLSISNMEGRFSCIIEYEEAHPEFKAKLECMFKLASLWGSVIAGYYHLKLAGDGTSNVGLREVDGHRGTAQEYAQSSQDLFREQLTEGYTPIYNANKTVLEEKKNLRKTAPELRDWQYDMMKEVQRSYAVVNDKPEYREIEKIDKPVKQDGKPEEVEKLDLTRDLGAGLCAVHYKTDGNPVEEDRELSEQNDRRINAWKTGDEVEKEKMAKEIIPHMYDGFTLPKPEDFPNWVDEQMRTRPFALIDAVRRTRALTHLEELIPGLKVHLDKKEHAAFREKQKLFDAVSNYINSYLAVNNIKSDGSGHYTALPTKDYETRLGYFSSMDKAAGSYEIWYRSTHGKDKGDD